jgi:DNA-binding response OmpR family regulator
MKVLIAEDDLISRRLLQKTLEEWGSEVITTENGREAWEIFQKGGIKFVVADWLGICLYYPAHRQGYKRGYCRRPGVRR